MTLRNSFVARPISSIYADQGAPHSLGSRHGLSLPDSEGTERALEVEANRRPTLLRCYHAIPDAACAVLAMCG